MIHPYTDKGKRRSGRDIIHRWEGNPVITTDDMPFACLNIYNAGAIKKGDEYILLLRVENMQGYSVFVKATGTDGEHFVIDESPILEPAADGPFAMFEKNGVEDPRITFLDGSYFVMYTAHSEHGTRLAIAKTDDFTSLERIAMICEPDNKSGVLFPTKINGKYVRLDRPREGGNIWISYSDDLIYWGNSSAILTCRGGYWDCSRIGPSVPPIEIDEGWLLIYYGVRDTSAGPLYRLSAALLDRNNPEKVIGRSDIPILSPREYYERVGDWGNVVFSCGAVLDKKNGADEIRIYYGASTTCICMGSARIKDIVDHCR